MFYIYIYNKWGPSFIWGHQAVTSLASIVKLALVTSQNEKSNKYKN